MVVCCDDVNSAAKTGHLACLEYLMGECRISAGRYTALVAAESGHMGCLRYVIEKHDAPVTSSAVAFAGLNGKLG